MNGMKVIHRQYSCSWCNRTLSRLIDSGGQNSCYYCNYCQIQFDPSETQVRKKSKLGTQREEIGPAVTSNKQIKGSYGKIEDIRPTAEFSPEMIESTKNKLTTHSSSVPVSSVSASGSSSSSSVSSSSSSSSAISMETV